METARPHVVNILDLSTIDSGRYGRRPLILSALTRDLFRKRSVARWREELGLEARMRKVWMLIDEAHQFVPAAKSTLCKEALVQWVKEGRQPGLSLVVSSQQPAALDMEVLAQCDVIISHALTTKEDKTALNRLTKDYMGAELRVFINKIARTGLNYFLESSVGVFLLEQDLEQVLTGDSLRWLPIETLEMDDEEIIQALDSECHVPRPVTVLAGRQADRHTQTEAITLEARIVGGRLRLSPPLTNLIRVQGDRIYLKDGRQLQIALASGTMPESQRG